MNYWADVCLLVSWLYLAYYGLWAASRLKYERNTKRSLEATIRTLENQISAMADKQSRYEGGAGLPLCGHCGMQGGKHHVACPTRLGNVTPLSGSGSEPQA
jgi:hypothetical protein